MRYFLLFNHQSNVQSTAVDVYLACHIHCHLEWYVFQFLFRLFEYNKFWYNLFEHKVRNQSNQSNFIACAIWEKYQIKIINIQKFAICIDNWQNFFGFRFCMFMQNIFKFILVECYWVCLIERSWGTHAFNQYENKIKNNKKKIVK